MTDKQHIPLGKKGPRSVDAFVNTGSASHASLAVDSTAGEREVTKTFRLPASLGRRLKVYAARTGQKEKDILIQLIGEYLDEHEPPG